MFLLILLNSTKDRIQQLQLQGVRADDCIRVDCPPDGTPMFLFSRCKGKKDGAHLYFDKGSGTALFKKGIPGGELDGVKLIKGNIPIGGIGGIKIYAEEHWIVSLEKIDGRNQLVQGLTAPQVTVNFPMVNLNKGVKQVKDSVLWNGLNAEWVRNCEVPKEAGGNTDAFIGIQCDLIHQKPVHSLPNGLTLYKSKLVGQHWSVNAAVDGPHSSFEFSCQMAGGAATVVVLFTQQFER